MPERLLQQRATKLLKFYRQYRRLPTYEEMVGIFGLRSKSPVFKYLRHFVSEGLLRKDRQGHLAPTSKLFGVKILGTVTAGFPSAAEEELADTMTLDEFLIAKPEATYLLRVTGDSMTEAGIQPGDLVIVERARQPKNGDIVIAEVDHQWTMKYYLKQGSKIILRAANKKYPDIKPQEELTVAGVIMSVIRKYH